MKYVAHTITLNTRKPASLTSRLRYEKIHTGSPVREYSSVDSNIPLEHGRESAVLRICWSAEMQGMSDIRGAIQVLF